MNEVSTSCIEILNPVVEITSCFHVSSWGTYAKRFLESLHYWPKSVRFRVFYHGGELPEKLELGSNVTLVKLEEHEHTGPLLKKFNKLFEDVEIEKRKNWRFDFMKWINKVLAWTCPPDLEVQWLVWLDADTYATKEIPEDFLPGLLQGPADIIHLGRSVVQYSETSFVAIRLCEATYAVLADVLEVYLSAEFLTYAEWHDGWVFERIMRLHIFHDLKTKNLTQHCMDLDAFHVSPLGQYLIHDKGPKKWGPRRYIKLAELIKSYKCSKLVEVGTNRGLSAELMIRAAAEDADVISYDGFDLWEDTNDELNRRELNGKDPGTMAQVQDKLEALATELKANKKLLTFRLHRGDSKDTLPLCDLSAVDFAFIDGGHSEPTVRSDYSFLRHCPVVVLDDVFDTDKAGGHVAPEFLGANKLIDEAGSDPEHNVLIYNVGDKVVGGGTTGFGIILQKHLPLPEIAKTVPLQIRAKDCVEDPVLINNVQENVKQITKFVRRARKHDEAVVIVSAGPSLKTEMPKIKMLYDDGVKIVCVKHSYETLLSAGIVPWGCIMLDPRPIEGTSTHGVVRKELLSNPHPDTIFFIGTVTSPEWISYLRSKGVEKIVGWNPLTSSTMKLPELKDHVLITGGTCAAMRAIGILHTLGFRDMHLFGYDSCLEGEPKDKESIMPDTKRPKYLKVQVYGETFWTTGELAAQAQDFEKLIAKGDLDFDLHVYGEGILQSIWNKDLSLRTYPSYEELIG